MTKIKWICAIIAAVCLLFIIQYQFVDKNSWKSWNLPLSGRIIILDPGHGGPDGGAVGGKTLEKDIALNITLSLRDYLQEQGALVLLTREGDYDLAEEGTKGYSRRKVEDLKNRLQMINESDADLYLSLHLNAIPSPNWRGAQTFYHGSLEENKRVSKFIQDELRKNLSNTSREAKVIQNIYLLKHAKVPGALVEVGFLSNPGERELLEKKKYQRQVAESIYKGINRYFTSEEDMK
ncbi:N-acetylmuramoyl-L-alanine amidase CwlD [Metabacillus iocasae]|uniref:N-acetylmuramoyl-L-alanine amidase n=1 Tax=Priestia iocasae TaxID=2291674 RepID=A0ABS2R0X4_9BACI|nr:N-acetylmuramoyl-L-alanine amidase CwlD [Metabacillus iocasae]MBM7705108.1 N-acetylmuramoyl-L-alanine amidase [Metabacillus iocasae]